MWHRYIKIQSFRLMIIFLGMKKMFRTTLIILVTTTLWFNLIETKCLQKNTKREANRDQYICRNQLFEPGRKVADPENCDCYYDCNYRQQPCYMCCPNGQIFNPKQGDCVLRSSFDCKNQPHRYRCEGRGLFAMHENCRKYWDCRSNDNDGEPIEESCPDNYHWNDFQKICRKDSEIPLSSRTCSDV
nr:peritrophin-1-like isoform X2 [Dermatophagoides farinae]